MIPNKILNTFHNSLTYEILEKLNGTQVNFSQIFDFKSSAYLIMITDKTSNRRYVLKLCYNEDKQTLYTMLMVSVNEKHHALLTSDAVVCENTIGIHSTFSKHLNLCVEDINAPLDNKIIK